jgi:hypothetical protein
VGRPSRRPHLARSAALALVAFALALAVAAPAQARWQAPFRVGGPYSLDALPTQMAFSATGQAAFGYDVFNEDHSERSQGFAAISPKNGRPGSPLRVPDTQAVLDLAFDGSDLELLIGTSPLLRTCCSSARLIKIVSGKPERPRLIFRALTGPTVGRLIMLPGGRLLSSVATAQGVWTELAGKKGRPAPARLLTPKTAEPQTLGATLLRGNRTMLAWTAIAPPAPSTTGPAAIMVANGTAKRAPRRARQAVKLAAGHQLDELAVGAGSSQGTLAWIESWTDSAGHLHSMAVVADLGRNIRERTFEIPGLLASGLSFASDPSGAQVMAWKVCDLVGSCLLETVVKDAGRRFGQKPISLGRIDPTATPAAAVSPQGEGLVGWIDRGHVLAAARDRRARAFAPTRVVSGTTSAMDLTLGFGTSGALAAWSEGTFTETVMGALFKP